jgi:hypothetical protein
MWNVSIVRLGAISALITVAGFFVGIFLIANAGVQVVIPDTGEDGFEWIDDVVDAGHQFTAGAATVTFAGLFGMVAFVGFYYALRHAGPLMIIAPVAGVAGRDALGADFETWAEFCLLMNYLGDVLIWAVTTPLFALALLKTRAAPAWIGWVGMVSAVFAGWLGLFSPLSDTVEGISSIGFLAFFIFNAALGVALLRHEPSVVTAPAG